MDIRTDHFTNEKPISATLPCVEHAKEFKDFILIAEFSERIGPNTVLTIPEESVPDNFDKNGFAIRVLSIDWQGNTGHNYNKNSKFSINKDVLVMLSEPKENAHALVYYITLYDHYARGNQRNFSICYISQDETKLLKFFVELNAYLSDITSCIHTANYELFYMDQLSQYQLLSNEKVKIETEGLPKNLPPGITLELALENIVSKLVEISEIVEVLENLLRENSGSSHNRSSARLPMYSNSVAPSEKSDIQEDRDDNTTNSKLQITHSLSLVAITASIHNYDRNMRTLPQLVSENAWGLIQCKLKKTVDFFGQDSCVLLLNRYDVQCLHSPSSLLTIGQYAVNNFLPPPVKNSKKRKMYSANRNSSTRKNSQISEISSNTQAANKEKFSRRVKSDSSTVFVNDISHNNIYKPKQQCSWEPNITKMKSKQTQNQLSELEASFEGTCNEILNSDELQNKFDIVNSPSNIPNSQQYTNDESSDSDNYLDTKSRGNSMKSTYTSYDEISLGVSDIFDSGSYETAPESLSRRTSKSNNDNNSYNDKILLYASSTPSFDEIDNLQLTTPGTSLYDQMFFTPNLIHPAYMLLSGHTVVCESLESSLQKFIKNMSIFVPGSFTKNQVKENYQKPICISKLNKLKLIGLLLDQKNMKYKHSRIVENNINKMKTTSQCAEYWGCMYDGNLLSRLDRATIASKDSNQILNSKFQFAVLQAIFLKLAMKAYVVFHYSLSGKNPDVMKKNDFLKEELNLKNSDWLIVQYLVKLIRRQILEDDTTDEIDNLEDYIERQMSPQYKYEPPNIVINYLNKEYSKKNTLPPTIKSSLFNK